uniref:Uncharacterized protein n=1 Tax=Panagrolaimus sp. PS1159 TaxID=55785 RepID=A0AC35FU34_9BILA
MGGWWFFWFFIIPILFIFFTIGSLLFRGTSYNPYWRRRRRTSVYAPDTCYPVYTIQSHPPYPPGQNPPPYPYYPNATGPPPYSATTPQYVSQPLYPMNPSKNQFY